MGVFVIAYMGSYPPWKEAGPTGLPLEYAPIYAPPIAKKPYAGLEIDFARLLLQIGVTAILTGGLVAAGAEPPASARQKDDRKSDSATGPEPVDPESLSGADRQGDLIIAEHRDLDDGAVIKLPKGKSYGEFLIESEEDSDAWEWLADAEGDVKLPRGKPVQLEIKKGGLVDLSFITMLAPDSLFSIDLSQSKVNDWDLANLKKLSGLKELDLSGTSVTSEVFNYLEGLQSLERLWLDGTKIDDKCLELVDNLPSLVKLSVTDTRISKDGARKLKEKLSGCEVVA